MNGTRVVTQKAFFLKANKDKCIYVCVFIKKINDVALDNNDNHCQSLNQPASQPASNPNKRKENRKT